jgi:hypothetical protein
MKKIILGLLLLTAFLCTGLFAEMINGVEIYKDGKFPDGKTIKIDGLYGLKYAKMGKKLYLEIPLDFKDDGSPNGKGGYTYTAKINRTWLGSFVSMFTDSELSDSVFKITFPYKSTLRAKDAYSFTVSSPLTIISKEKKMGSNTKSYDLYNCIYQGYLTLGNDTVYPKMNYNVPIPGNTPAK